MKKIIFSLIAIGLMACSQGSPVDSIVGDPPPPKGKAAMKSLTVIHSQEDLTVVLHDMITSQMESQLDAIKDTCQSDYINTSPQLMAAGEAVSATQTNLQEADVDEMDTIKAEGKYVYSLSNNGQLRVNQVWPATSVKLLATMKIEGYPSGMFLDGKTLVVLSAVPQVPTTATGVQKLSMCYLCGLSASDVLATTVDVSNPASPEVRRTQRYTGQLISARRVSKKIVLAIQRPIPFHIALTTWPTIQVPKCSGGGGTSRDAWLKAIEVLRVANQKIIDDNIQNHPILAESPKFSKFYGSGGGSPNLMTLVQLDTASGSERTVGVLGSGNMVYASSHGMVVADQWGSLMHYFPIAQEVDYANSVEIKGHLINSFAISEYEGTLRVATTGDDANQIQTFRVAERGLETLGELTGIAKGEKIYAVRFLRDKAYVVTFKQVDPLFVISLRDPAAPKILGELKVPGFSTYLHVVGNDRLIGIGHNVKDQGSFTVANGIKLSLFDVSNDTAPAELSSTDVGKVYSSALYDHHAFVYDDKNKLLAIPTDGFHVYQVDPSKGFTLRGSWKAPEQSQWTGSQRCVILDTDAGQRVVSVDEKGVRLHTIDDTMTVEASVVY